MMKTVIAMPTYNEAENLCKIVPAILSLTLELQRVQGLEVLVIDDNSPDGTGQAAEGLAKEYPGRVHVLHRDSKQGLGRAYIAGFHWALGHGADYIFEMDADFSHNPVYIPRFLEEIKKHDVVVGSRYVPGGGVDENWSMGRRVLSWGGNLYARLITGLKVRDTTAGFKCFRRDALLGLDLEAIRSDGYAFQIEMALACQRAGYNVKEIPITFWERQAGKSKMSWRIALEALWRVWQIRWRGNRSTEARLSSAEALTTKSKKRALTGCPSQRALGRETMTWILAPLNRFLKRPSVAVPKIWIVSAVVFLFSLALYIFTLAPTVLWGDFAGYQTRVYTGEITAHALVHPLWLHLARLFILLPVGDVAFRVNLSSAFFAALALVAVLNVIYALTNDLDCPQSASLGASLLGTCALMISHTFWTYAVVPKPYSLNCLVLSALIYLLLRWGRTGASRSALAVRDEKSLYIFALMYGLSIMNHLVMVTAAPGFFLYILLKIRRERTGASRSALAVRQIPSLLIAGFLLILGLVPYWLLLVRDQQVGTTGGFVAGYVQGFFGLFLSPRTLLSQLLVWVLTLGYQFFFCLVPALVGLNRIFHKRTAPVCDMPTALMLLLIYLGVIAFVLAPPPPGPVMQHWHLFITSYVVVAVWIGLGLKTLLNRWQTDWRKIVIILLLIVPPMVTYAFIPNLARPYTTRLGVRDLPGRDTATFLFTPWKRGETGARDFGQQVLTNLPSGSVLFSDWTPHAVLKYLQVVEGQRPDLTLVEMPYRGYQMPVILEYAKSHDNLFIADTDKYYDVEEIKQYFDVVPWSPIYQLVKK